MRNFLLGILFSVTLSAFAISKYVYEPSLEEFKFLEKDSEYNNIEYFFWGCVEATSGETDICKDITKEQMHK